jgi:hypothetical protein
MPASSHTGAVASQPIVPSVSSIRHGTHTSSTQAGVPAAVHSASAWQPRSTH